MEELKNYINGIWMPSSSPRFLDVKNPATDKTLAKVPLSTAEEVEKAVDAALCAFPMWRKTPALQRVRYLFKLKMLLEDNQNRIAETITNEHGKEFSGALGEMRRSIEMVEVACGVPSLMKGEYSEDIVEAGPTTGSIDEYVIRVPLGVFAIIAPFNFPAMIPFWFWPFAIACGNTVIIKPSERCPLTQQKIMKLIEDCGLPRGVVNLINGGREVGEYLIKHPNIKGISFVGSTPVAKQVYENGAKYGKRMQCQGGAKNYAVVMPDANLDQSISNLMNACFGNTGQRCLSVSTILVVEDIYDEFKQQFLKAASNLKIGYGLDENVEMGPVISRESLNRLQKEISNTVNTGAKLLLDGRTLNVDNYPEGYWLGPTIFEGLEPGMKAFDEELFGPVISIKKVKNLDEAIELVNQGKYGNASTIYTENGAWAREYEYRVNAGNIGINIGVVAPISLFPFSGMKDSFFGDLHGQSMNAIQFFTEEKVVIQRWFGKKTQN